MTEDGRFPVLLLGRGGNIDGQQRQLLNLASGLDPASFPLTVAVDRDGQILQQLRQNGIEAVTTPMRSWRAVFHLVHRMFDAEALLALARARNVRIVHANDQWRAPYARYVARRLAIPYVVHVRGPLTQRDIRKHRLADASAIVAIARRYVDDLAAAGVEPRRICLVDDSVDLSLFDPALANASFLGPRNEGHVTVGLVGSISPFKRVRQFLDVVAALPSATADKARFVIVGEGAEPGYLNLVEAAIVELQIQSRIELLGRVANECMPDVMASLDLLVTMSGGSVMFEAMAMGRPVLSIRADGRHSEHTRHGDTAICADTEDAPVTAAALAAMIDDPALRARLGIAGRKRVEERLSAAAMAAATAAIYGRVLAESSLR